MRTPITWLIQPGRGGWVWHYLIRDTQGPTMLFFNFPSTPRVPLLGGQWNLLLGDNIWKRPDGALPSYGH